MSRTGDPPMYRKVLGPSTTYAAHALICTSLNVVDHCGEGMDGRVAAARLSLGLVGLCSEHRRTGINQSARGGPSAPWNMWKAR